MKFGKLENIHGIDHTLPPDHPKNAEVLKGKATSLGLYFGGTMWNVPAWKGKIYPAKLKAQDMLKNYASQFGTIELNATHYRTPTPETVANWRMQTPASFRFCPKWPQSITHYRRFANCTQETEQFLEACFNFEDRLGPCFIQLPPNFAPNNASRLIDYLRSLPRDLKLAVEFRHPDWFGNDPEALRTWEALFKLGIGAVISDTSGRRDAVHMHLTAAFLLLRFGGNEDRTDLERMEDWARRLENWYERGLEACYVLMHQADSIRTPESCNDFFELIQKRTGLNATVPRLIQPGLF